MGAIAPKPPGKPWRPKDMRPPDAPRAKRISPRHVEEGLGVRGSEAAGRLPVKKVSPRSGGQAPHPPPVSRGDPCTPTTILTQMGGKPPKPPRKGVRRIARSFARGATLRAAEPILIQAGVTLRKLRVTP